MEHSPKGIGDDDDTACGDVVVVGTWWGSWLLNTFGYTHR
jgi:hypothetical protein